MYRITYVLGGEQAYRDRAMRIVLAALTLVNKEYFLATPNALPLTKLRFEEEAFEADDWLDASALQVIGKGDCEDLACYAAGWLQARHGVLAWPQLVTSPQGDTHVVVEISATPSTPARQFDPSLLVGRRASQGHACTGHGKSSPEQRITVVTDLFKGNVCIALKGQPKNAGPTSQDLSHRSLTKLLYSLFLIDQLWLKLHPETPGIYQAGVRYEEEPPGREDWQDIPSSIRRKNADCEDLATWRAAELVVRQGINARPSFIWRVRPSGAYLYHIQTTYPDGTIEDPSRTLGMGA